METTTKEREMPLSLRDFAAADLEDLFEIVNTERTALRNTRSHSRYVWAMMRLQAAKREIQMRWENAQ
jgi:hypothetical protein